MLQVPISRLDLLRRQLEESDDGYVLIISAYHPVACARKVETAPEEDGLQILIRTLTEVSTAPVMVIEKVTKDADGKNSLFVTYYGKVFAEIKGLVVPWEVSPSTSN